MRDLVQNIKKNSQKLLDLSSKDKENIILDCAKTLKDNMNLILKANEKDLLEFNALKATKDRLKLDEKRILSLCEGLEKIAFLEDPIAKVVDSWENYAGLQIQKVLIPIGVICVIFEARPAISAEILALMLKSSNACILKGGSEAKHSNKIIFALLCEVLQKYHIENCYLMLESKEDIAELLKFDDLIDVIIPRGGSAMIENIAKNTKIPLIKQDKGLCHTFVDQSADLKKAAQIVINAKCQRVSVCNALETLLIHESIAKEFLTLLSESLEKFHVKIYADTQAYSILKESSLELFHANDESYKTEWLDYCMSIKIVKDVNEAICHINTYSSLHSEAIISENQENILKFQKFLNSACIYVNASTRFSDGAEFGFGAEVGISTSKLHARGPMGVKEICTYKYLIKGSGQIRQ